MFSSEGRKPPADLVDLSAGTSLEKSLGLENGEKTKRGGRRPGDQVLLQTTLNVLS